MTKAKRQDSKVTSSSDNSDPVAKTIAIKKEQHERIEHIHHMCKSKDLFSNRMNEKAYTRETMYYASEQYNFTYCRMPKAGSTSWAQIFMILNNRTNEASSIFGKFRKFLRIGGHPKILHLTKKQRQKSRFIFVTREPYARLYSAYVDRLFLPGQYGDAINITKLMRKYPTGKASTCSYDVSFQELLSSIPKYIASGKELNMHWTPTFSICDPCHVNIIAIVKMESFSDDVEFALKEIGIPDEILEVIKDGLHDKRIELVIPGTVQGILESLKSGKYCMNPTELARRVWVSLQIQGFINDSFNFPFGVIDTQEKAANHSFLTEVILKTIKENPLTPEESKQQKRRALVNAYAGVDEKTLRRIRHIFKQDFMLYGYSDEPPK